MADLAGIWGASLPDDLGRGVDEVFKLASSEKFSQWFHALAEKTLEEYGDSSIGELLSELSGTPQPDLADVIAQWAGELIRRVEEGSGTAVLFLRRLLRSLTDEGERSIAEILGIEEEKKQKIDQHLYSFTINMLNSQVPQILESVDVHNLVVEKINSLDIEKVEELILIVIRTHLRYIILFGAVLGFLIGSVQVLITKLL
ncbi:MAG TPA: DUF445 family protein [Sediminispirochaeta sp.]|nr:DUF445 family protein [Sediminispirochaeta sp.]